ncbi:MAG TPA: TolC family protein [Thermoanaerobaculia bacterium]|nr:TolC family protein [Thermoanaerobaculia bacterium]
MSRAARLGAVVAALTLGGCATVPVRDVFSDAAAVAAERTGQRVEWAEVSAGTAAVDAQVRDLLARPLDANAAVQVALLNNRRLQARYAELGRAAAAKVQAGLPANPFLEVVARFRDGEGDTPQLEISLVQEVLDLFLLPARKRLAAVELERAKLGLAAAVVDLAAATREAFVRYQAERQLLEVDRHVLLAVEAAWEMAGQLRAAGNISELDLLVERDFYEQVKLEVSRRELAVIELRGRLDEMMGLWGERAEGWTAEERLPELPEGVEVASDPEGQAVARSLDIAGAVLDLEAAARRLRIADVTAVFPELEIGAEGEREVEHQPDGTAHSEWWYGPSVAFRLPVFDQGQPRRVGARMEIRRRWDELVALGVEVRAAARVAATRLAYAERQARYVRDVVMPVRTAVVQQTQLHYNGMFVGVFQLLDAKRREMEAARAYVAALRDYWLAESAVEQLLAGRLPAAARTGRPELEGLGPVRGEGAEEGH